MHTATMHGRQRLLRTVLGAACAGVLAVGVAAGATAVPDVLAYPSAQTIRPSGAPPPGGSQQVTLAAAGGEREAAWVVARGGGSVAAEVDGLRPLSVSLAWGHFVRAGGTLVPDALLPWDGSARDAEQPNQPIYLRVEVPRGTAPGTYTGTVTVTARDRATAIPVSVRVFGVTLPEQAGGRMLTSFHVSATTYLNTVARLHGFSSQEERRRTLASLYAFLAEYSISPSSWGFGEPRTASGYASHRKWWLDSVTNMKDAAGHPFGAMRVPVSSNRTAPGNRIAGLSPHEPERWCDYLRSVRAFWEQEGWLGRSIPYLYAFDEPDLAGMKLVARQSKALHACWPGARSLVTGNPSPAGETRFLADRRGGDDVDIWAVLTRRYYGRFTSPGARRNRSREVETAIDRVRTAASIWSYTYSGTPGTPGLAAVEPLSNPRQLVLWNALEGIDGLLYGQGTTTYDGAGSPYDALGRDGELVLLYPGKSAPVPSARLEQLRDGFEDWAVLEAIRRREGDGRVRAILGRAGLFSADRAGVKLACHLGCTLKSATKYSWPLWSQDATTPARIEQAHLEALRVAG